jgi:hypothetical protein
MPLHDLLNNREIATFFWVIIIIAGAMIRKDTRSSLLNIMSILLDKKMLAILIPMFLYIGLVIFLFNKINVWQISMIGDTVFWISATAFVLLLNTTKATQGYFRKLLFENIKFVTVLDFIVNLYNFNLLVEIVLVPVVFSALAIKTLTQYSAEAKAVHDLANLSLTIFGLFIGVFTFHHIFQDFQSFISSDNLRSFLLLPLLTFAYIPFLYGVVLLMKYEESYM